MLTSMFLLVIDARGQAVLATKHPFTDFQSTNLHSCCHSPFLTLLIALNLLSVSFSTPFYPFKPLTITSKKGSFVFHYPCQSFPCRLCTTTIAPSFSLLCSLTLNYRQIYRPHLFSLPQIANRTQTHSTSFPLLTTSNASP
ncbi:hypothetical protein ES288_A02G084400v1 [Gossypium darwinii]|uniref:Uncharacterized protein n=2 Tax=Gossypium TaxID=3633 RepID=A0A5D2REK3_GOSTO|nr:hypothetical protein ES288_A02G084400v1 [Gossypium darwinii]TYI39271.1 hypothetical protein ES332_A02G086600v1 [Gossypium tomentosum]